MQAPNEFLSQRHKKHENFGGSSNSISGAKPAPVKVNSFPGMQEEHRKLILFEMNSHVLYIV